MADQLLGRAFNRVLASQRDAEAQVAAQRPRSKEELEAEALEQLRASDDPMSRADAIERVLLAEKDENYFRMLELPTPEVDALGRPVWPCSGGDVSKAYRRLSALVHPDKNPGPDARKAFEALNKAHRLLRDPAKLEAALTKHQEAARRRRDAAEAALGPGERAAALAAKRTEAKHLRKAEADKYSLDLLEQRRRLQDRAKRKQEVQKRASMRAESEADEIPSDGDAPARERARESELAILKRRKKPKIIF